MAFTQLHVPGGGVIPSENHNRVVHRLIIQRSKKCSYTIDEFAIIDTFLVCRKRAGDDAT